MAITVVDATSALGDAGTLLSVPKPSGTAEGDILVLYAMNNGGSWPGGATYPSGFVQWDDQVVSGGSRYVMVLWKRAGASEPETYDFGASTGNIHAGAVCAFRGCVSTDDPATAVSNTLYVESDTIIRAAALTAGEGDALVWLGWNNDGDISGPADFTDQETVHWYTGRELTIRTKLGVSAGDTGAVDGTNSSSQTTGKHAMMVALAPEPDPDPAIHLYHSATPGGTDGTQISEGTEGEPLNLGSIEVPA